MSWPAELAKALLSQLVAPAGAWLSQKLFRHSSPKPTADFDKLKSEAASRAA